MVASIPNDIFQFSTYSAIENGFSQGQPRASDLSSHGTDGIGFFENGYVMILANGSVYTMDVKGHVKLASPSSRLPFAMVTIFQPMRAVVAQNPTLEIIDELLSSVENTGGPNTLMPFKIEEIELDHGSICGTSMHKNPTAELITNMKGVIFGFVVPNWMKGISGQRVHCYFLSSDIRIGGRLLGFQSTGEFTITFARCGRFHLGFPQSTEWEELKFV